MGSRRGGLAFAEARTAGGMTLSGPNAWRGSMKDVKIFPHFLHSAVWAGISSQSICFACKLFCFLHRSSPWSQGPDGRH